MKLCVKLLKVSRRKSRFQRQVEHLGTFWLALYLETKVFWGCGVSDMTTAPGTAGQSLAPMVQNNPPIDFTSLQPPPLDVADLAADSTTVQNVSSTTAMTGGSPPGGQIIRLQNVMQSPIQQMPTPGAAMQVPMGVAAGGSPQQQQLVTLPNGQQMAVRAVAPQIIQMPAAAAPTAYMPVQIPVNQNGQTVLQTVQMPVQQAAAIPQLVQTPNGQQQVIMQQVIQQPQPQPQFAQIITPNGQVQQVQVINPMAGQMIMPTQFQQPMAVQPVQAAVAAPAAPAKVPDVKKETPEEVKASTQPASKPGAQMVSVRTANGQIVQVPTASAPITALPGTTVTTPPTVPGGVSTVNIPGIGTVQILNTAPQPMAPAVVAAPEAPVQPTQQALQQDSSDPSKWHVVQVANQPVTSTAPAPAMATAVVQPSQSAPSSLAPSSSTTASAAAKSAAPTLNANGKPRLRRVACTCPNCKDGDRSRNK